MRESLELAAVQRILAGVDYEAFTAHRSSFLSGFEIGMLARRISEDPVPQPDLKNDHKSVCSGGSIVMTTTKATSIACPCFDAIVSEGPRGGVT